LLVPRRAPGLRAGRRQQRCRRHGNAVEHYYDDSGRLTRIDDSLERSIDIYYDQTNTLITKVTDWNNRELNYAYDQNSSVNRLTKVTFPDSSYLSYQYDSSDKLTGIVDPGEANPSVKVWYDSSDQVTKVVVFRK